MRFVSEGSYVRRTFCLELYAYYPSQFVPKREGRKNLEYSEEKVALLEMSPLSRRSLTICSKEVLLARIYVFFKQPLVQKELASLVVEIMAKPC